MPSQLFEAGVGKKTIQSRSGHRSTDALRMYERITPAQQQAALNILTSGEKNIGMKCKWFQHNQVQFVHKLLACQGLF